MEDETLFQVIRNGFFLPYLMEQRMKVTVVSRADFIATDGIQSRPSDFPLLNDLIALRISCFIAGLTYMSSSYAAG